MVPISVKLAFHRLETAWHPRKRKTQGAVVTCGVHVNTSRLSAHSFVRLLSVHSGGAFLRAGVIPSLSSSPLSSHIQADAEHSASLSVHIGRFSLASEHSAFLQSAGIASF